MSARWVYYGAALLSAASWALGSILWRRLGEALSPAAMNLSKGLLGSLFLGGCVLGSRAAPLPAASCAVLAASGVIGIAIGDTFFFKALLQLGPRLTSLVGTLYPVSIAVGAAIVLGERPSGAAWCGILLTVAGVGWVLWERGGPGSGGASRALGVGYALLALLSTTAAVLLAKVGVAKVPAMQAALVRLGAGTAGLLLWGALTRGLAGWMAPFRDPRLLGRVAVVVAIVVFGGFWLSLVALKHVDASVAGTLNATSPLFVLPLSAFVLRDRVSLRAVFGTAVSVVGVALLFLG